MSKNGALQLLLIVDHVFEWAREIYREDVIKEFRIIASGDNDCASIAHPDPDIYSTISFQNPEISSSSGPDMMDSYALGIKAFQELDNSKGIVRHATFIESRFRCLFVTRDNVETLLQSTQGQVTEIFARHILNLLADGCVLLNCTSLNIIEEQWTGQTRISRQYYYLNQTRFYAIAAYASFLLPDWQQVRELTVIAIAQDAFDSLVGASKYKSHRKIAQRPSTKNECDPEAIKVVVTKLRAGNGRHTLLAAVRRVSQTIDGYGSNVYLKQNDGTSRIIVQYVYSYFKKGQIEPQESFLHVSNCFDQSHLAHSTEEPYDFDEDLNVSPEGCVLIRGQGHSHDAGTARLSSICVYFTDGPPAVPTRESLGTAIKNTFENYDVYHTSRIDRIPNIRQARSIGNEGPRWNIERSYGLYSTGFDFVDWLVSLGYRPPVRQGSPRGETCEWLFTRELYPWHKPGYINVNVKMRVFIIYKIVTREIRYWRSIAQERRSQGIDCCEICASEEEVVDAMFEQCYAKIYVRTSRENWFLKALVGEQPIDYDPFNPDPKDKGRQGYERFELKHHEVHDLNVIFERNLSFYEDLDKDFDDMRQLKIETMKFLRMHRDIQWPGMRMVEDTLDETPKKRKRTSSFSPQANNSPSNTSSFEYTDLS